MNPLTLSVIFCALMALLLIGFIFVVRRDIRLLVHTHKKDYFVISEQSNLIKKWNSDKDTKNLYSGILELRAKYLKDMSDEMKDNLEFYISMLARQLEIDRSIENISTDAI